MNKFTKEFNFYNILCSNTFFYLLVVVRECLRVFKRSLMTARRYKHMSKQKITKISISLRTYSF